MNFSPQDAIQLNHFMTKEGRAAIELLGNKLYGYYAQQAIDSEGVLTEHAKGAARLSTIIKNLPEILANVRQSQS
jgi:hypothetical protein